jgi:hypothetical protein
VLTCTGTPAIATNGSPAGRVQTGQSTQAG